MSDSTPEFEPPSLEELSALLPQYRFDRLIAKGGMGAVYEAEQIALRSKMAIKINPRELTAVESLHDAFAREAQIMAQLSHPNIIGLFDYGETEGVQFLAMEYVSGQALHYSIFDKQVEQGEALRLVLELCRAVEHIHSHGLLHRDIKPGNIMLDENLQVKLGDFGLAVAASEVSSEAVFGTPGYAAPEVTKRPKMIGPHTDVYAIGAVMYELLTGDTPPTVGQPPAQATSCGYDRRLDAIVARACHLEIHKRTQSVSKLIAELEAVQENLRSTPIIVAKQKKSKVEGSAQAPRPGTTATAVSRASLAANAEKKASAALVRNLIIIAVLIAAIVVGIQHIQKQNVENARKVKEAEDKREAIAVAKGGSRKAAENNATKSATASVGKADGPLLMAPPKSALEELQELQAGLVSGKRDVFPKEAKRRGQSVYLYLGHSLPWHEAQLFAAEYGAQLAVLNSDIAVRGVAKQIPDGESAWIGASSDGNGWLKWLDGSDWHDGTVSIDPGNAATLDKFGLVSKDGMAVSKPLLLEWKMDGSIPAGPAAQLAAVTAESIEAGKYPVGTMKWLSGRFLYVAGETTWREARERAKEMGGSLASLSKRSERVFLTERATELLPNGASAWVGGYRAPKSWKWLDGSRLDKRLVEKAAEDEPFVALKREVDASTAAFSEDAVCDGFFVKWSDKGGDSAKEIKLYVPGSAPETDDSPVRPTSRRNVKPANSELVAKLEDLKKKRKAGLAKFDKEVEKSAKDRALQIERKCNVELNRMSQKNAEKSSDAVSSLNSHLNQFGFEHKPRRHVLRSLTPELRKIYDYHVLKHNEDVVEIDRKRLKMEKAYDKKLDELATEASGDEAMLKLISDEKAREK